MSKGPFDSLHIYYDSSIYGLRNFGFKNKGKSLYFGRPEIFIRGYYLVEYYLVEYYLVEYYLKLLTKSLYIFFY